MQSLNGLKTFTSKGWNSWKMWIGKVSKSKPTFFASSTTSKVIWKPCPWRIKVLIKRRNAIGASLHQFDKMNNPILKQLVDHLGFGLHGHCGTIFAMLNVILRHSIAFEIEKLGMFVLLASMQVSIEYHSCPLGITMCIECDPLIAKTCPCPWHLVVHLIHHNSKCGMSLSCETHNCFWDFHKT